MTTRHRLAALAAATLTIAATTGLPSAQAETQAHDDAVRDVQKVSMDEPSPRRRNKSADLTRVAASYGAGKLVLTAQVRELAAAGYDVRWQVKTPTQRWLVVYDRTTAPAELSIEVYGSAESPCAGLVGMASDRLDRVRVTVPRACLGTPRWVRVGTGVQRGVADGTLVDDGRRRDEYGEVLPFLGPRLRYS